ncbi:ILI1 binding bHLH 1 [Hibiscus trionum]|uniref:ILI1 binding bHLH 1 n=1 Tax=Hibiscus trionum TaxID=183268 RepID=A0A9W7LMB1_HIBTR|nr:ILI1 binding bHLH 1 [Hibiscus trionum]
MNYKYNPSSLKSRFATRFLRALTKIHAQKPISSSSPTEIFRRYRRIKAAADKSMAYSVRSRRTWSRAMLWKLRTQSCGKTSTLIKSSQQAAMKQNKKTETSTTATTGEAGVGFGVEASELRELVPGGEAMDYCNLLDETAHYIKCLTTQVQVMKKIAHFYSL